MGFSSILRNFHHDLLRGTLIPQLANAFQWNQSKFSPDYGQLLDSSHISRSEGSAASSRSLGTISYDGREGHCRGGQGRCGPP